MFIISHDKIIHELCTGSYFKFIGRDSELGDFATLFFLVRQNCDKFLNNLNWNLKNLNSFIYTGCSYVLKLNK
jgi:hypothetical protein